MSLEWLMVGVSGQGGTEVCRKVPVPEVCRKAPVPEVCRKVPVPDSPARVMDDPVSVPCR